MTVNDTSTQSHRTSLRMPFALWRWLVDRAAREGRTVSNLIVHLLEQVRSRE